MTTAQGFAAGPLPFGLDRPLELRGGGVLGPDRLVAGIPLDWQPDLLSFVAAACRRQTQADRPWLSMPPVALLGPEGSGRTHAARTIARHAGLPFLAIDVAHRTAGDRPLDYADAARCGLTLPTLPVLALAATRCANPLVLVTGVDLAGEDALGQLSAMIDPVTAGRWVEQGIRATIDLGQVSWMLSASTDQRLPPALSAAVSRVAVNPPAHGSVERRIMAASVLAEVMADLGIVADDLGRGGADVVEIVGRAFPMHQNDRGLGTLYARLSAELLRRRGRG